MMRQFNETLLINHPELKRKAVQWCHDHGINTHTVPMFAKVDILDDEHLELEVYETTANGNLMWDETKQRPKMRWLHVKYNRPIPEELLEDG